MIVIALLLATLSPPHSAPSHGFPASGALSDTVVVSASDLLGARSLLGDSANGPEMPRRWMLQPSVDTVRPRPRAVDVSDAYELRLRIHRYASYTMIPLFVVQSVAGNQLYQADRSGSTRPGWAETTHGAGAAGLGALFTVNTVTGLWNLWDSRDNEVGRTKRWIHSALLLGSDAGFTWSGIKLASDARNSQSGRDQHRRVSYISMGAALAGYAVMLVGNH
jgi:hypothetical protein